MTALEDLAKADDLTALTDRDLTRLERQIASRHMGYVPWFAVAWAFVNLAVWLSLWPLVFGGIVPLWLGFLIATLNVMLSYLPSHEAQHDIIAKPGEPLRWLNELVGHLSTVPMWLPYGVAKLTHMEHHKHANDPEKDPDYSTHAESGPHAVWKSLINRQPRAAGG
ncbi:MAG: fatty acid desaturase, partial [Pseudomonadota bacterium]